MDDHGGPYRAALHTALGEEPAEFLGLLSLCMNAKSESGTFVFTCIFTCSCMYVYVSVVAMILLSIIDI